MQRDGTFSDRGELATTIFEAAGGADGMRRLADAWHERAMADDVVEHAFSHGFRPDHNERLAAYLGEALGGLPVYSSAMANETEVQRLHAGNGVHVEMDEHAVSTWVQAVDDLGFTGPLRTALIEYWTDGVRRMSSHPDTPDSVPSGLSIPQWP